MTIRDLPPATAHKSASAAGSTLTPDSALVFALVFGACLFGIGTRPAGFLAAIWPANALLLGLFVRYPQFATPMGWAAAVTAYVMADLATGSTLRQTLILACGNLVPVAVGYALYRRVSEEDRRLKRPFSVLYLTMISACAAAASSLVGAVANPIIFGGSAFEGMLFWSVTEFVNFIVLLPVALTIAAPRWPTRLELAQIHVPHLLRTAGPILALIPSCLASWWIGGPGALAFPVPALLWCALVYSVATTSLITFVVSSWMLIGVSIGAIALGADVTAMAAIMSLRMGVALMALAPLNVASVMAARREFQILLQRMVTNDPLTAALTRRAFAVRVRNQLNAIDGAQAPLSILMFDIDGLSGINQRYGHEAGDQALKIFSRIARSTLPEGDNLGRVGSDEFAVLLVGINRRDAEAFANRICIAFDETPIEIDGFGKFRASVTAGIASPLNARSRVDPLLNAAEVALRQAKESKAA